MGNLKSMGYSLTATGQIKCLSELLDRHIGFKTDGHFVEVGAHDGRRWSSTWSLMELGWRGLMFEPHPEYFRCCVENHKAHDVKVIQIAISDRNGETKLYLGGSLSTIKHEMIAVYNSMGWSRIVGLDEGKFIIVPTSTLDTALMQYDWKPGFDLLVVDVEGAEIDVFMGFDLEVWCPKMIIVETHEEHENPKLNYKAGVILEMLTPHRYTHVYGSEVNSIYVKEAV